MNTTTLTLTDLPAEAPAAAKAVLRLLRNLRVGTLDLQLPNGSIARFGSGEQPHAAMRLLNWDVCSAAIKRGDIGFAEASSRAIGRRPTWPPCSRYSSPTVRPWKR